MASIPPRPPGHVALRRGRASESGRVYFVTCVTRDRRALFADPILAHTMAEALLDRRLWPRSRLLAWVLMPDHWHGLIELGAWETLPDLMCRLKSNTPRHIRFALPLAGFGQNAVDHRCGCRGLRRSYKKPSRSTASRPTLAPPHRTASCKPQPLPSNTTYRPL
ncbi:transposase [Lysobacter antibioticus]|uniref:transposase n=1 Tax=Lysobacter antibioticus TaxID=84531 RepID=UPI0009A23556|nr:transposase [Lysobacter antibioticus]